VTLKAFIYYGVTLKAFEGFEGLTLKAF